MIFHKIKQFTVISNISCFRHQLVSFVGYCGFRWGQCNFSAIYVPAINSRLYEKYVEQYYPGMVLPLASQKYFDNMIIFLMVCKVSQLLVNNSQTFPSKIHYSCIFHHSMSFRRGFIDFETRVNLPPLTFLNHHIDIYFTESAHMVCLHICF